MTEAEWLGNVENRGESSVADQDWETSNFEGTGIAVSPEGVLAIVHCTGGTQLVVPVTDIEMGNLAEMISAVLS